MTTTNFEKMFNQRFAAVENRHAIRTTLIHTNTSINNKTNNHFDIVLVWFGAEKSTKTKK